MATSAWTLHGHKVALTHSFWFGNASITVDDEVVFRRPCPHRFVDYGFVHCFEVDGIPAAVRVVTNGVTFRHDFVNGDDAAALSEANALPMEHPERALGIILGLVLAVLAMLLGIGMVCKILGR